MKFNLLSTFSGQTHIILEVKSLNANLNYLRFTIYDYMISECDF